MGVDWFADWHVRAGRQGAIRHPDSSIADSFRECRNSPGNSPSTATIDLPPNAPGVIFTLDDGQTVLIRPVNDFVFFRGPIVDRMEIFYATGEGHVVNTTDCM